MAVDDIPSRQTDALVLPNKTFYPLKIPIAHYQLRHFISSPEQDLVYYASGPDVYCVNVATKIQAHVTTLPFEARCTASGHGWICVGGEEDGNFAAIRVKGFPPVDPSEVDASLPLDLGSRTLPRPPLLGVAHRLRLEKIGEDIVNSISIHKFEAEGDEEAEIVAVLTNNDKTVRLYSLTQNLEVSILDLKFPMNHATISPDGNLLVAVGDLRQAFFFERVPTQKPSMMKTPEGRAQSVPTNWRLINQVQLHVPSGALCEGYFTTAWSPFSRLCAVGSECGYITVFDVDRLRSPDYDDDAVVQLIKSTRPDYNVGPGAVRTMLFSPPPWDLLIWSEDQARVCVADIRSGLKTRQVLTLDPKEEGLEKIEVADFELDIGPELRELRRETDFIRNYRRALDPEGNAAAINFATDYAEALASHDRRRANRQRGFADSDNDPHGLTAQEQQILDALRSTRQTEDARDQRVAPRSINYIPPTRNRTLSRRDADTEAETESSLAELMRDSALRQLDVLNAAMMPRRQASIIITNSASQSASESNGTNITNTIPTRSPGPIPPHARRANAQIISQTDDAWRTIEEAMARNVRATENSRSSAAPELRTELRRLRQLTQQRERLRSARDPLHQPLGSYDMVSMGPMGTSYRRPRGQDPSNGVRTAGLAMSQDGRKLYCGTEEGIFEFDINVHERKLFPAIFPR
jgi:hypothetical protein